MTIQFDEDKQKRKLSELLHKEEEDLVQLLSGKYGVQYISLLGISINTDALRLIDEKVARDSLVAAFAISDKKVKVAARNPDSQKTADVIADLRKKGFDPEVYIVSTQSLEKAWKLYVDLSFAYESKGGALDISTDEVAKIIEQTKGLPDIIKILEETTANKKIYRVSRILETIVAGALAVDASDIHQEPEEGYVRLRYRLDGVLQDVTRFDNETYALLLSRIKLISGMKLNIKKDAQDGRFSIRLPMGDIEVRVSILPGAYNESIVMRLLNPKSISVSLEDLGINPKLLATLLKEIDRPDGMTLTTGPTGSGKTTTLYAFLKKIHNPDVKIITIEDPIEYHLPGIVQTQVNDKGYDFLGGLRAAVRQDPDIIMIGEIRDHDTADIAINSALTGHLVFSTIHTNDAAGTFPRLIELGVSPKIIPSALRVSMAQRLVRRLCLDCKKEVSLTATSTNPTEAEMIVASKREIDATLAGIVDRSLLPENTTKMWVAVGCDKCNMTGYKGRVGVYEAIFMTEKIEKVVETNASDREIWEAAKDQGYLNMKQDGVIKVLQGMTSLDELTRVISVNN